jgi:hypothetical protein
MKRMSTPLACALGALAFAGASSAWASDFYKQRNLVSDSSQIRAEHHDPRLVNAWGLAFNPFGVAWVADNGTGFSTLYDGDGKPQSLIVTIPGAGKETGNPTGTVFYGGPAFVVSKGAVSGPSRFLFVNEDGGISGWSPTVDFTHAIRVVDNGYDHAIYKGVAISGNGRGTLLYATDFHNGKVNVFDATFKPVYAARPAVLRSEPAVRLRALRHPGHQRRPLRQLRQAGRRPRGRREPGAGWATSTCTTRTAACCGAWCRTAP